MSHLEHIVQLKEEMLEQDIPLEQQSAIITNAYVTALVRNLIIYQGSKLYVTKEYEDQMWDTLNMWNDVTPVKGGYIVESVKQFVAQLVAKLTSQNTFVVNFFDNLNGVEFDTTKCPTYETLVLTLMKEFEEYIYHGANN